MTLTLNESDIVQPDSDINTSSQVEFEKLSIKSTDTPENVSSTVTPQKPLIYTNSNIVLKPDDVVSPGSVNSSVSGSPTISTNSPRLIVQPQQRSPSFQNARPLQYSPSFQNHRPLQYSPSFQRPPPFQNGMPHQRPYPYNPGLSRQPTAYYADHRPPPPSQQFQYRQGAPLPPQPMMSGPSLSPPQQQQNNMRPPPPPTHNYYPNNNNAYNPQMRPIIPPTFNNNSSATIVQSQDGSYLADSSVAVANSAGKKPKGSHFPPANKETLAMYRKEAEGNNPHASLELAKFLVEAANQLRPDEQDPKRTKRAREAMLMEAQKICKKLAAHSGMGKQGYADAQFYLANCYGTGAMGLQTDPDKAFALYIQGSKQSHPDCTFRAAVCYEVGAGTKRDKNHAIQFYRKAANLGNSVAMYKLGMILLKGFLGQPKNPREGISWLKRASQQADEDHPHALHELGLAFEKEGVPSVIPDLNYARELFTQAAQYGYAPSQFKLGLAYENGFLNCPVDPRRSIAWYSKAAEQGDLEAEFALSGWYLTGAEGVLPQSDAEAYLWARKAADKGNAKAEYAVGYYTETGTGVRPNLEEAKRWYMRAAAQNYRRAMQRLTELKYSGARQQQRRKHTRDDNNTSSNNSKDSECTIM
ncbi:uncharacterized protein EV154DRAFT_503698 [Mucor mucedo]|uniref:uncharacterized protein n=1 Tax=Mucor mucedo TaxID=29922 RepID=UPI00221FDCE0|nr:uncharacterized protein EV154DRAFT_503698 [Mucor mucedo]KAI7892830.1 hypothetical protein EV154DRAFT_503698 [Mucor mucedo]